MTSCIRYLGVRLLLLTFGVLPSFSLRSQNFKTLHNFSGSSDGGYPASGLTLIGNTLYGTAAQGGSRDGGTVYSLNSDGTAFQVLCNFPGGEGVPSGDFVISDNVLYTIGIEPSNGGSIIAAAVDGTSDFPIDWYNFYPLFGDGSGPDGVILSSSLLYGGTRLGGQFGDGTVYAYDGSMVTNLYSFAFTNGGNPNGTLVLDNGTFYGVTLLGGNWHNGTVYTLKVDGSSFKSLHHFSGTNGEGALPLAGLVLSGNTLFGTTSWGGATSNGTVFSVGTDGTGFTTLHSFTGGRDGAKPATALNLAGNTLYGTTTSGGDWGQGTVFAMGIDGSAFTTLHSFNGADGASPKAKMLLSSNTLYGTTYTSGSLGHGTVFSLWLGVPTPQLTITPSGPDVVLTWATNGNFFLESAPSLVSSPVWSKVSPGPVVVNGLNTVTDVILGTQKFYRLSQ